ncbi:MAG: hypothetical protein L6V93_21695 [Clostridiales bacterium]|nr:MAG: hypothetical protein L6V93_21695 [Clostridiales bacterium]
MFDISLQPNYENINLAMGGGTLLVKDGQTAKKHSQHCRIKSAHRTRT